MNEILRLSEDGKTLVEVTDKSVRSVTIPEGVTCIGDGVFSECHALLSVQIPDTVLTIEKGAFYHCDQLGSVFIPDYVTEIGDDPFNCCFSLRCIEVGADNPYYSSEDGVLYDKTKTKIVRFPASNPITEFSIPYGVTVILPCAFKDARLLKSLHLPDSVRDIGWWAFCNCRVLEKINIPSSVVEDVHGIFDYNESLPVEDGIMYADTYLYKTVDKSQPSYAIKEGTRFIGDAAFMNCTQLCSIHFPDSIKEIDALAFSRCSSLETITIPDGVTRIGWEAFGHCPSLRSFEVGEGNEHFMSEEGILFDKAKTAILRLNLLSRSFLQPRIPLLHHHIVDGISQCHGVADDDADFLGPGDTSINEVSQKRGCTW